MAGYLLDTSAVNRICNGEVDADTWSPFYITDLVLQELSRTRDHARRTHLLGMLRGRLGPGGILRSESPCVAFHEDADAFDSPYDAYSLSVGRSFPLILRSIGSSHRQHWRDAFIVQAAMMNGLTLVTADKDQAKGARRCGLTVEFIEPMRS